MAFCMGADRIRCRARPAARAAVLRDPAHRRERRRRRAAARVLERSRLAARVLHQLPEVGVQRELPALEERLQVVPAEAAHRVVQAALRDRPLDELVRRVESVEGECLLEPPAQRHEGIGRPVRQGRHHVLGLPLGDLAEPAGIRAGVRVGQGRRPAHRRGLDVLELGHAREHALLARGGEADPDPAVRAAVPRDHLDLGDRSHAPLGALRVANLLADLERRRLHRP
jgi:hypothetical protein